MSVAFQQSYHGSYYQITSEGSIGTPLDVEAIYQLLKNTITGQLQLPQNYGTGLDANNPYELCENNANEWTADGDMGTPTNEAVDVSKGNYSIRSVKSGSGTGRLLWNNNGAYSNWRNTAYSNFGAEACMTMVFEVKPSVNMTLDSVQIWGKQYNSVTHAMTYQVTYTNGGAGWSLTGGVWNEIVIDLTNMDSSSYRIYLKGLSAINFSFSGGATSDVVLIDGLRLQQDEVGAQKIGPAHYIFRFPIYLYLSYFKDDIGTVVEFVAAAGSGTSNFLHSVNNYQFDWGPSRSVVILNIISTDEGLLYWNCNVGSVNLRNIGVKAINTVEQFFTNGTPGPTALNGNATYPMLLEECSIHAGDVITTNGNYITIKDSKISSHRYPIWGEVLINNVTLVYQLGNSYIWCDRGTIREVYYSGWLETGNATVLYQRSYRSVSPYTTKIIDWGYDGTYEPYIRQIKYWITEDQRINDLIIEFYYTFGVKVTNAAGEVLEGARVTLLNNLEEIVFQENTDVDGVILKQDVLIGYSNHNDPPTDSNSKYIYPDRRGSTNFNEEYYPFNLTIEKAGFATYTVNNLPLDEPFSSEIALQVSVPLKVTNIKIT